MTGRRNAHRSSDRASRSAASSGGGVKFGEGLSGRAVALLVIFLIVAGIFFIRLFYLQVIVAPGYAAEAAESRTIDVELSPKRGTIYDRNGTVLATSVDATTIYCNPREIEDPAAVSAQLAALLGGKPTDYVTALSREDTSFSYIQRKADVAQAQKVQALEIPGIYFLSDTKRVYPNGAIGGQLIGLVSVDGEGLTGLELYYDDILSGEPGHLIMEEGATGLVIAGSSEKTEAVDGRDIVVSIDLGMQQYAEEQVAAAAERMGGESGQVILMDGASGEIIACASSPLLNPTDTEEIKEGATTISCISSAFEPGSIFKPVTMLAALEEGVVTPDTRLFCPAYLPADEYFISDAHERGDMTMSIRTIMENSSNVGLSLTAKRLGFDKLYEKIGSYHLDEELTGVDYPGEAAGYVANVADWTDIQSYNASFGQGLSVTPLQMVRFYSALATGGEIPDPHFLISLPQDEDADLGYETIRITDDAEALADLNSMLIDVVENGTGMDAAIDGIDVAGKTGTAEYVADNSYGYVVGSYNLSFIGYLPNSDSDLVCYTGVTKVPCDSTTTAIFHDIMSFAIERYNVNSK